MHIRIRVASAALVSALVVACTHDFGAFDVQGGSTARDASASGGSSVDGSASGGSSGASGNGNTGGSQAGAGGQSGGAGGSSADSGSGGVDARAPGPDASSGGVDSGTGAGGTDAGGGCGPTEKRCGASCVANDDPATGCGGPSCLACTVPNTVSTKCTLGECSADVCLGGYGDCNSSRSDGCEHDVTGDPLQCGACARACSGDNVAARSCNAGACTSTCAPGRANCSRPTAGPDDGCELDATTDAKNCGGCNNDCTQQNGKVCQSGVCGCASDMQCRSGTVQGTATCDTGTGLCACNANTCRHGESCRQGACACNSSPACTGNQTCCRSPSGCRDLTNDAANCGACGRACTPGFACTASACVCDDAGDCNAGTPGTCSGGVCHCGASTCAAGERCLPNGQCG